MPPRSQGRRKKYGEDWSQLGGDASNFSVVYCTSVISVRNAPRSCTVTFLKRGPGILVALEVPGETWEFLEALGSPWETGIASLGDDLETIV